MSYTRRHMCTNIQGMLNNHKKKGSLKGIIEEDGRPLSDAEARLYLHNALAKGWRVIPCGDCEGFDYQTGCPGHPITKEEYEKSHNHD